MITGHSRGRRLLVGALTMCILGVVSSPVLAKENQRLKVRLDWVTYSLHAPFHLSVVKGWFKQRGLDVSIVDGNGSVVTVQLVGTGKFDVGHANLAAMIVGRSKGLPVKAVASFIRKSDMGVLVPATSGIKTPKDLEGKKVIYTAGSLEAPFLDAFFRAGGTSRRKIRLTSVDAAAKISTYVSGRGDAVISTVPYFLPILKLKSNYILFDDYGLPLPGFGLIASDKTIKRKPEALRNFVEVVVDAWKYILDGHEDEGIQAVMNQRPQAKLNPKVAKRQIEAFRPYFDTKATKGKPVGWMAASDWAATIKAMGEAGVTKAGADPQTFFTNEFMKLK